MILTQENYNTKKMHFLSDRGGQPFGETSTKNTIYKDFKNQEKFKKKKKPIIK